MQQNIMKNKKVWIDVLRAIACVSVVLIHIISGYIEQGVVEKNSIIYIIDNIILQPLIRFAVIIFIMISGMLLLDNSKNVTMDKIFRKMYRMIIVLLTFGYFYCLLESVFNNRGQNFIFLIKESFYNLISGNCWVHMWYVYMLIGIYFITPMIRVFINNASEKEIKFTMLGLFIFSICIPTINKNFNLNIQTFYLKSFSYVFIFMLGHILYNKKYLSNKIINFLGILGFTIYLIEGFFEKQIQTDMFMLFEATMIFNYFVRKKDNIKSNKVIDSISNNSFAIYLIHPFWINLIYKFFKVTPNCFCYPIGEILLFIIVFLLSYISSVILHKIPYIKKLI